MVEFASGFSAPVFESIAVQLALCYIQVRLRLNWQSQQKGIGQLKPKMQSRAKVCPRV